MFQWGLGISLVFLILTTALLVKDLDQPKRFLYVLLRPQWRSWLVRGGYGLTLFGGVLTLQLVGALLGWERLNAILTVPGILLAAVVAVYTAFLFAQARGRDFWQSPLLPLHMLVHSLMAGGAVFVLLNVAGLVQTGFLAPLALGAGIVLNLLVVLAELTVTHPTADAKATVAMIVKGRYRGRFWWAVAAGNILPLAGLLFAPALAPVAAAAALLTVYGIFEMERIWVEAPQQITLS